jgi:hypothetical protein
MNSDIFLSKKILLAIHEARVSFLMLLAIVEKSYCILSIIATALLSTRSGLGLSVSTALPHNGSSIVS